MPNTVWNSADKSANVTLSGGSLTAASSGASGWVRAVDRQGSGKFYWEITASVWANASTVHGISRAGITPSGGAPSGMAIVYRSGQIWYDNANTSLTLGARANGDIIGIALDLDAALIWFRVAPAGNWNGSASADPATGAGGVVIASLFGGVTDRIAHPVATLAANLEAVTANFGDTAFSGTVPSGYTSGFPVNVAVTENIFLGGLAREALVSTPGEVRLGGLVREALVSGSSGVVNLDGRMRANSHGRGPIGTHVFFAGQIGAMSRAAASFAPPPGIGDEGYVVTVIT